MVGSDSSLDPGRTRNHPERTCRLRGQVEQSRHVTLRTMWGNDIYERMSEEPTGTTKRALPSGFLRLQHQLSLAV